MDRRANVNADAIRDLDRPELAVLWGTMRTRLEQRPGTLARRPVKLTGLADDEVVAICGVLGRRRPSKNEVNVNFAKLDEVLRTGRAQAGLVEVLEALGGPLRDLEAERSKVELERLSILATMYSHPVADDRRVHHWLGSFIRRGRLARLGLDGPDDRLEVAMDAVDALLDRLDDRRTGATDGDTVPIAVLAASWFGDAHALDAASGSDDRVLSTIVNDAVLRLSGTKDPDEATDGESPTLRAAWAKFGVEIDAVNSSVLVLNLPGPDGSLLGAASAVGEPLRLTSRMVRSFDVAPLASRAVWVCENPSVVALAADRLGAGCAPMVCTDGMPKSVTSALLGRLAEAGVDLRVHADFDVGGVAIASFVVEQFGAVPWRFGRSAYLEAISQRPTLALPSPVGATPWDPRLADAMNEHRLAVHEEALVDSLLADVAGRAQTM